MPIEVKKQDGTWTVKSVCPKCGGELVFVTLYNTLGCENCGFTIALSEELEDLDGLARAGEILALALTLRPAGPEVA